MLRQWDDAFEPFLQLIGPGLDKRSQQAAIVFKMDQPLGATISPCPMSQLLGNGRSYQNVSQANFYSSIGS